MALFFALPLAIPLAAAAASAETEPGGDPPLDRMQRIEAAFNGLSRDTMDLLERFYDDEVVFEDPLGRIEGLDALRAYYENMYRNVTEISFHFGDGVTEGDTHVVTWEMRVRAKGLNRGREVRLEGNSLIRFGASDRVIYHRDYFDMGAMVYEHVPVVKHFVRAIKRRLAHDSG